MTGHTRKRGSRWEVILELGEQSAQRCAACRKRYWADHGRLEHCPRCGTELQSISARRQIILPERFATKKEAEQRLTRELSASLSGTFTEPAKLTVGEYLEEHWLPAITGTIRPTSMRAYRVLVEQHLTPSIGHRPLQRLGTKDIDELYARLASDKGLRGRPLAPATCRAVHRVLHRALAKAVEWNLIPRNPADAAERPKLSRAEMKTWTKGELALFLQLTEQTRLHPLWCLLAMTGMRRGEALGLHWSDVDLGAKRVTVRRARVQLGYAVQESDTKTGRSRVISVGPSTAAALRRQSHQQLEDAAAWGGAWVGSGHVFTREDGEPWHPDRITKLFDRAVRDSELPRIRLHDLRHTCATLDLEAGTHPRVVQEKLGHANVAMTLDTYSHVLPALQESAAARLEALVFATS